MNRGEVVTVAIQGDLGKPRPALVIQADVFSETTTVTILPITGEITDAPLLRVGLTPNKKNGLRKPSQIMIDKPTTLKREKVGQRIGVLDSADMIQVDRSLALFLGIAA